MWPQKLVWYSCAWKRRRLPLAGIRFAAGLEVADVRDALFLVDEQVVDDVEVFRVLLREQAFRRVAVVAAVIHVHVQVGGEELAEVRRQVVVLQPHRKLDRHAGREVALDERGRAAEAVLRRESWSCLAGTPRGS